MPARRTAPGKAFPRHVLVIDVGGTHIKFRIDARGEIREFRSGPHMTPGHMVRKVRQLASGLAYDAVAMGYPGPVFHGRIAAEPHNLGSGWVRYNWQKAFGKPVRIVNDAALQAIGSYGGERMLFLGLGTGLGAALIIDGIVQATEIAHMHYRHGHTFEDYLGEAGRERRGNHKWRKSVADVVASLSAVFEPDYVVLGGGNAERLKKLPRGARLGDNRNAFIGGVSLWRQPWAGPAAARRRR